MHTFIAFRLYGPLAAWGDIAVGERRPTTDHPSKSAVLGLLAAALGIQRNDDRQHAALANGYRFAVRVDAVGVPLRDYHTSQLAKNTARLRHLQTRRNELADRTNLTTVLSTRDYRADALYTVCLYWRGAPDTPMPRDLSLALLRPRFPLYLGRRACPLALPLAPRVIEAQDLPAALTAYDEAAATKLWRQVADQLNAMPPASAPCWWETGVPSGTMLPTATTPRYDQPRSRLRHQFAPRDEHHWVGGPG
ncbi:type I-E CRISPR-associated protein Cas5/CasD [uncultured Thiohalocapsa sp.]|uniref:type I-E CRISPR-associated protein Cas5/CasD n=1 Tax=uncultured Thiohalocapsa sp. TaxID=768990 RepID=UPI0025E7CE9C|nr:type I-E CRISPR-associated protein Cas5/CasD [uncultured Thiohalocapsa sp.]